MTVPEFRAAHPGLFYLDPTDVPGLTRYLTARGLLGPEEAVLHAARAGEGNMNQTVRVTTGRGSLIVKQSRPWVEKYPQFAAPWDRSLREIDFYRLVGDDPRVARWLPRLVLADRESRILVLEDLGVMPDHARWYQGQIWESGPLEGLADFLTALHRGFVGRSGDVDLRNRDMRALNHAHLCEIPLQAGNGLDLDRLLPGLEAVAAPLRADLDYGAEVARIGRELYLADGPCLIHGDFFPGSLLPTAAGPRVIDPEFCAFAAPEIDVGVFVAHLWLGQQPAAVRRDFLDRYAASAPAGYDERRVCGMAGVELMRRLLGYAQLPLAADLALRRGWLELSRELVLRPDPETLRA
jgi:5-methylthioribose kinase